MSGSAALEDLDVEHTHSRGGGRWRWWALAVAALVAIHVAIDHEGVQEVTFDVVTAGAAAAAWTGAAHQPRSRRLYWRLVALGVALSAVADGVWSVYALSMDDVPNLTAADVFYLGSYVPLFWGLLVLLTTAERDDRLELESVIDTAIVATITILVVSWWAVGDVLRDETVGTGVRAVWAAYPIMDAALLALVIRVVISNRSLTRTGAALIGGALCWLFADLGYLFVSDEGAGWMWLDAGWMVGAALLGAAVWLGPPPVARAPESVLTPGRIALGLSPLLVPATVEVIWFVVDRDPNPWPLFVTTVVLVGLAFVRAVRMLHANEQMQSRLRSSEQRFAKLAAHSADAVVIVDTEGCIIEEAPAFASLIGYPNLPTLGVSALLLVTPDDLDETVALFGHCLREPGQVFEHEVHMRRGDDQDRWFAARIVNLLDDPDVGGVVVNLRDITDRKHAEAQLSHQAFHDSLTQLPNRALLTDRIEQAVRRASRSGLLPVVVYLDLDGFKLVNDSLGHEAGDHLLQAVAQRLLSAVRTSDTVARLGGDEFAILIEECRRPLDEAEALADRVLHALATPVTLGTQPVVVSASIGIAAADAEDTASSLLRDADIAMYQAKASGRAQWVVYEPAMRSAALERLQLETDLVVALEADQLRLVFQPVVNLETEDVVGFEALLRWEHPTLGLVMPDRFIPIAEDNGLIVPIGAWVLRDATKTAVRWQHEHPTTPPLTIAVNLSARQLASESLVRDVTTALSLSGLDPSHLVLEMTESALVRDTTVAARRLRELRELGVRLAIDDFGTGYSSLSYLRQFPVDILKIDRSFVNTITDRHAVPAIVRGLLDLGRTLELEMVAEGVELAVQRDKLREERCTLAQGYLFARPLEVAEAETFLTHVAAAQR